MSTRLTRDLTLSDVSRVDVGHLVLPDNHSERAAAVREDSEEVLHQTVPPSILDFAGSRKAGCTMRVNLRECKGFDSVFEP